MSAEHADSFHHVRDFGFFELPGGMHIDLPEVYGLQVTKFMVLQLVAFAVCLIIFRGLARNVRGGKPALGRFWNFWEAIALFIRDEVVRPTIGDHSDHDHHPHAIEEGHGLHGEHGHPPTGEHDESGLAGSGSHPADRYLPFLWSCFFYILICNLLGAIPFLGSATGSISVTAMLALCAFIATVFYGFQAMGPGGFFKNMMPDTGVPGPFGMGLTLGIFGIEIFGFFIKHSVLAVRLFANIMGGHTVLGVILAFIASGASLGWLWAPITAGSIGMQIFIGALELFVAFLQAYVFTFLATIFIAGSVHEH
jgi:F-type H+-transporting ATPase subunit a